MIIREATPDDIPGILECLAISFSPFRAAYTEAAFAATILDQPSLRARLAEMCVLIAVVDDDSIVGTIACGVRRAGVGQIRGMAVLPSYQGAAVASALLAKAIEVLRRDECHEIVLGTTAVLVRAIAFYERHGFRRTGRVKAFHGMDLHELSRH